MGELFQTLGKIAGLAGISIGVLLVIFREIIRKNIFPNLNNEQAYKIIRLVIILTFLISLICIFFWFIPQVINPIKRIDMINATDTINVETNVDRVTIALNTQYEKLKAIDVFYDEDNGQFDLKLQNNSNNTVFISKIRLKIYYSYNWGRPKSSNNGEAKSSVKPSGKEKIEIDNSKVSSSATLNFDKIIRVSYKIPPHDVDRYIVEFNLNKSKLFEPRGENRGDYHITIAFIYNRNQMLSINGTIKDGKYHFKDFDTIE